LIRLILLDYRSKLQNDFFAGSSYDSSHNLLNTPPVHLEFERLLHKHATETGLPVVVDFYSDGCGPCRQMAPIFKKLAKEIGQDKAVFVKVDTNAQHELSSKYQIRSLPTFVFFLNGKKWNQFSGAGEGQLRQMTQQVVQDAEMQNVQLTIESLTTYYNQVEPSKSETDIDTVYQKCVGMVKGSKTCVGAAANTLARKLKKKYKSAPKLEERFSSESRAPEEEKTEEKPKASSRSARGGASDKPNLNLVTKEQLMEELERRLDAERDEQVEEEDDDDNAEEAHSYIKGNFPEKVVVIGGGPAGMSAAIYAARANLQPVVIAPPMGGQLQGKGVDVENYPGLFNMTGPGVVAAMRNQAAMFGAVFEGDLVISVDVTSRPMRVITNSSIIETHSIIVATGAESNWLGVPGEYELRGGGVSSCATCDGAVFRGKEVVVIGGGDSAMEDALVLARTSSKVTVIHRRGEFRASKILAQRVLDHPLITVRWNTVLQEIVGKVVEEQAPDDGEDVNLDNQIKTVKAVKLMDIQTQEVSELTTDAVFVAIGHTPTTKFMEGVVEFDDEHPGYLKTVGRSTKTTVEGIFAAGDVSDAVYRQAITSAGSGAAAALDAERYLSEEGLGNEAAEMEAELMAELMMGNSNEERISYNAYADVGGRVEGMRESLSAAAGEL
jgi:thioredoxin reductase (NADPH)